MKDLLFDFTYYQGSAAFHGGGEYGNVILNELLLQKEQINCGAFFRIDRKVDKEILDRCRSKGWNLHAINDWRNLTAIVKEYGYQTIYSALPYSNEWKNIHLPADVRFVATIHGLRGVELADCEADEKAFFVFPGEKIETEYIFGNESVEEKNKQIQLYADTMFAFNNCKIITDSEHSKHSILYYYPQLQDADIEVLYAPLKLQQQVMCDDSDMLRKRNLQTRNFGLIVNAGFWYKNGLRAMMAYDRIFERGYTFIPEDYKVVITGVKDTSLYWNRIKNKDRFVIEGYVTSEELECFYRNAQLFVYPSLNEGFGYPPIEAARYGTLCACSVNTSIAEICQDMVLYFNPLLIDEIAIRILESFNEEIRKYKLAIAREKLPSILERQQNDLKKLVEVIAGED